jgi:hypothetical protein
MAKAGAAEAASAYATAGTGPISEKFLKQREADGESGID